MEGCQFLHASQHFLPKQLQRLHHCFVLHRRPLERKAHNAHPAFIVVSLDLTEGRVRTPDK
jgi:hypothetical protein